MRRGQGGARSIIPGHRVVALDSSATLIDAARAAGSAETYLLADARTLPFSNEEFDIIVAYNSLLDVDELEEAVSEAGRLLRVNGHLCVCTVHPILESGSIEDSGADPALIVNRDYLSSWPYDLLLKRDGIVMNFHSHHRPIEHYAKAFESAGLVIDRVREPRPTGLDKHRKEPTRWARFPMFLHLRGRKVDSKDL